MRGIGLSLIGLAAAEAAAGRSERRGADRRRCRGPLQEEGIVVAYSDETPGRDLVERARAALSAQELERATTSAGVSTLSEALDLARTPY